MVAFPYKIIDLTHTIDEDIPSWDGDCGFKHEIKIDYADYTTDVQFRVQKINMKQGSELILMRQHTAARTEFVLTKFHSKIFYPHVL
ncbi:MAG: hypothetical protein V4591_07430 [Bdellovibrionota bacterium]